MSLFCIVTVFFITLVGWAQPTFALSPIVIEELLADPPNGLAGDANHDGVRHPSEDEFVELLNVAGVAMDLSGWTLWDPAQPRHQFEDGLALAAGDRVVVFGGGLPTGIPGLAFTASSGGLGLNNTGDELFLRDIHGTLIDHVLYGSEGNFDQSLTRQPSGTGPFQRHTQVSTIGLRFSPGTDADGQRRQSALAIPEPLGLGWLAVGLAWWPLRRRSSPGQ